jgi:hypothetical protein
VIRSAVKWCSTADKSAEISTTLGYVPFRLSSLYCARRGVLLAKSSASDPFLCLLVGSEV